ncbi:ROK family protein [Mucilaginibacter sabulilitoris]|uniref:ROK family protein n=1 Tax=Mucilaginibacter sabulilitoris TaxID=1173583 RepID=A0ABZ0TT65_9SPHI|nr:ROK family protein [Mucilaginibacter sabulilitoris]WPU96102.1 ROK family protein [Mucilaginibacter sabulilitoris]
MDFKVKENFEMPIKNIFTPYILSVDIGGSHITAAVCNYKTNTIMEQSQVRIDINSQGSAEDILLAWSNVLKQVREKTSVHISGLSLAIPGPFDYENGISYIKGLNKYESIYGANIKYYLAHALQIHHNHIKFRNDAEATIAGECIVGAGKEYSNVIGVTLGTGFGSAHFIDRETWDLNLGSLPFKETIADDYLSTRGLVRRYYELSGKVIENVKKLASIAIDKDPVAKQVFEEFAENLSNFLKPHIHKISPDCLILCGNIALAADLFLPFLKNCLNEIKIELAQMGEHAALFGAADLFKPFGQTMASAKNKTR